LTRMKAVETVELKVEGMDCEGCVMNMDGETVAIVTLERSQVRPVEHREITHARRVA